MDHGPDEAALTRWIEQSLSTNKHILAAGYQGKTLLFRSDTASMVIKVPHGRGLVRYIHTRLLRHEYDVYKKLEGFSGVPKCYGLVDSRYLALEYIAGHSIRDGRPVNEQAFHEALIRLIRAMHRKGVAHMDLKRKDNLFVTDNDEPCLLDFGTAVILRNGFHPLNHFRFKLGIQFDYNAWVKHKYHDNMRNISEEDRRYYKKTIIEKIASGLKRAFSNT